MATKHVTQLIDDLDGTVLEEGDGQQMAFSVDGRSYEIDLSESNAADLRRAFAPYVEAARSIGSAGPGRSRRGSQPKSNVDLSAIREWARANGHTVSDRGRVPGSIVEAFQAATA
ncbi:Lsr2 family protein [Microbacterium sp. SL62]|uniref:histone-like nucleoid-structuring protein Lsr2 n=1 Tax=Microbacterium sp. SL62 TaxID=2995139 RepID=UPI002273E61C|nr:Lsr2 family protein [Microbacterium sp. SL62]MCY1718681.1 Lsr2 family protein [Microbacterium sp. SL62]